MSDLIFSFVRDTLEHHVRRDTTGELTVYRCYGLMIQGFVGCDIHNNTLPTLLKNFLHGVEGNKSLSRTRRCTNHNTLSLIHNVKKTSLPRIRSKGLDSRIETSANSRKQMSRIFELPSNVRTLLCLQTRRVLQ